jgi:hypothetical protein
MAFHKAVNDFQVILDGDITGGATTITVSGSLSPISAILPVYLTIESEIIEVTAVVGQDMTAVRGVQGTSGVAHLDTTPVNLNITAAQINELIDDKQDAGGSAFGSEYAFFQKVGDESSISITPVIYHTVNTPVLPAGTYRIENMAILAGGSPSQIHFAQVTVDGSISSYTQLEPKDANNQESWTPFNQFTLLSPASVTINLEYGKISGTAALIIKESRITYWRVN